MTPLAARLDRLVDLTAEEADAIATVLGGRTRHYMPGEDILVDGEPAGAVNIFHSGWAIRWKLLADGRRQILAFIVPGDICDIDNDLLPRMDHTISAFTALRLTDVAHADLAALMHRFPRLYRALRWDMLVSISIQREWTVNLGQRTAFERFGHFFCEMLLRLRAAGLAPGNVFPLPATQADLADAMGVSTVHANRIIQELRQSGLIQFERGEVHVLDFDRLARIALFDDRYLHLGGWRPDCDPETRS